MLIGIDGNEANIKNRVGVNTYAFEILQNLYLLEDISKEHRFVVFLKDKPSLELPKERENWQYKVLPGSGFWIIKKLTPQLFLEKEKPDVFFSPSHYVPLFAPMPRVCAIMDLGYLEFSEQFKKKDFWQLKLWTAWSINVSKHVIVISETTRKDIVRRYPSALKKTSVTLLGYDKVKYNPQMPISDVRRVRDKYIMGRRYVLFMSTLKPSKNIEGLLEAWGIVEKYFPETVLVIAGKKGWLYDKIFEKVKILSLEKRVIFTDFIPEEDKPAIIRGAEAFVLPSFWEGFGLDVVSALACGVPVIVSDRGSLPEIAGKSSMVINPDRPEEIAGAIKKVLRLSKNEYNKLSQEGIKWASSFSWQETAKKTMQIFLNLNK
jgi:glycosyltransferase involved in cell wall biosynthesis